MARYKAVYTGVRRDIPNILTNKDKAVSQLRRFIIAPFAFREIEGGHYRLYDRPAPKLERRG